APDRQTRERAGARRLRPKPAAPAGPRSGRSTAKASAACSSPRQDAQRNYRSRVAKARPRDMLRHGRRIAGELARKRGKWLSVGGKNVDLASRRRRKSGWKRDG